MPVRRLTLALPWVLLLVGWLLLAPLQLGGAMTYVATHGDSMEPGFRTGDLAVLRAAEDYRTGDVVAYRSALLDAVVMHRIVGKDGRRYTLQGDNNSWLDPENPTQEEMLGALVLRIPQGGLWQQRLTNPKLLTALAIGLLVGGGTAVRTRHGRKRKRKTMAQHAQRAPHARAVSSLPPWARTALAVTAMIGLMGLVLAVPAWLTPTVRADTGAAEPDQTMRFSYQANVPPSAAYDDTSVTAPDPIFRKLADTVAVRYAYTGRPGSITVDATLSTASGWRSTVPLRPTVDFDGSRYTGTVQLDLAALESRAQAAARIIGIPATQINLSVVPTVRTSDGTTFEPALAMTMTPLQLTLDAGADADAASLTVLGPPSISLVRASQSLDLVGRSITVKTARYLSLTSILAALLTAALLALTVRYGASSDEGAIIRRRYATLLVPVQPVPNPSGRPMVDVVDFATLAKLAERYGLLVLHWSRSGIETFVVQDESTTYRYRTGAETLTDEPAVSVAART